MTRESQLLSTARKAHPLLILIPLLLSALPAVAAAQGIRGQVVDESRSPVSAALVSLLSETEEVLRTVEADDEGNFQFERLSPGPFRLRVERFGYETMTTPTLLVEEGFTVEVELRVAVDAIPLEPLVIRQRARTRRLDPLIQGFYERRATEIGLFLEREEIEERQASRLSDLLRGKPGVIIRLGRTAAVDVRFLGGLRSRIPDRGKGDCRPSIWIDGMLVRPGGDRIAGSQTVLDDVASPHEVEGIEIYRHAGDIPARYNTDSSMCGVILIWTR
jgi:hypothetical protein